MRLTLLASVAVLAFAVTAAVAADPTPSTAPLDDNGTDAARRSFTEGAPAADHSGHTMSYSTNEPDLDRKRDDGNKQVNVSGVVEARAVDSQIICRYAPIIGSRLSTKLCLPLSRWKQMHEDAQQLYRDQMTQGTRGTLP